MNHYETNHDTVWTPKHENRIWFLTPGRPSSMSGIPTECMFFTSGFRHTRPRRRHELSERSNGSAITTGRDDHTTLPLKSLHGSVRKATTKRLFTDRNSRPVSLWKLSVVSRDIVNGANFFAKLNRALAWTGARYWRPELTCRPSKRVNGVGDENDFRPKTTFPEKKSFLPRWMLGDESVEKYNRNEKRPLRKCTRWRKDGEQRKSTFL